MDVKALFNIDCGLYILTAAEGTKDNGCIINTVMQVTNTPNRIAVAVNKANLTHDMIKNTGVFNVSVLTEDTPFGIFEHFGFQSGRDVNKFENYGAVGRSSNGVLYVKSITNAYISGRVENIIDLDTHSLFIAEVTDCVVLSDERSVNYTYYQKNIKPKPEAKKPENGKKRYVCKVCGYIYEGDELPPDYICPLCKHGAEDFELIE